MPTASDRPNAGRAPTWSVMIPVHNCADLLVPALGGVVEQLGDRDDVQIEVVDDASTDDPEAVVRSFNCPNVSYHRNPVGLGAVGNFNECLRRSRGQYVHLLHGDDCVKDGFYRTMEAALDSDAAANAALSRTEYIDATGSSLKTTRSERNGSGEWTNALETLAVSNRVRPPAIVVRRSAYERVGGFREELPHAADWDMWVRIAADGPIWFVDEVLAQYRVHGASDTAKRVKSGANIDERLVAIADVVRYVDEPRRNRVARRALMYSALFASRAAAGAAKRRDLRTARHQIVATVKSLAAAARPRWQHRREPHQPPPAVAPVAHR